MRKKQLRESVSLPYLEGKIVQRLKEKLGYGWFSAWVSAKIREEFFALPAMKPSVITVLNTIRIEKEAERNALDNEICALARKTAELKVSKEIEVML